ncbi:hypothetical protein V2J09_014259 [Rumex salicifolius]
MGPCHSHSLPSSALIARTRLLSFIVIKRTLSFMGGAVDLLSKEVPLGVNAAMEDEYSSLSKLLLEFTNIATIDKAWTFSSGKDTSAMFSISQVNLLANKRRKSLMSSYITKEDKDVTFQWSKFPVEMSGVSTMVPSPSGSKLLVVRNPENDSPTKFEIWNQSHVEMEFHVPQTVHGSVYADGFEGVSWNSEETLIAYIAEEPSLPKPTFNNFGYKNGGSSDKDSNSWKGQGEFEEGWGETYVNKRRPTVFVIDVNSGEVNAVKGIKRSLSAGQVVWAPSQGLVFVGWSSESRKLGIKYCYNRPCALYFAQCQFGKSEANESALSLHLSTTGHNICNIGASTEATNIVNLTGGISSAFFPRFSPDGKSLVFVSAKSAVDSGAHSATNSLHKMDWPSDPKGGLSQKITDVVPVVMCPKDSSFPGLYCSNFLTDPWLSDGRSMIVSSMWGSAQVILSVDTHSGSVTRVTPPDPKYSWNLLALDEDNIIAVCSSLVDFPQVKYGYSPKESSGSAWSWQDVPNPAFRCSTEVHSLVSALECSILKIPVNNISENSAQGANQPFEAIFVSSKEKKNDVHDPLIVVLHGGPHSAYPTAFSKPLAFLSSIGSLGFGEEALQSLPGKIGSQDVNDVLTALDHLIEMKLASPSKIAVLGGSHGGFLTTHLIGQAPERFDAAVARNPVCNLQLMVGTTDIPDWCFFESYGTDGKSMFTEAPSMEQSGVLHRMSPISHINKVKTPTLFLIGAQDLRVPSSNGLQFARALQEKGVDVKTIVFPEDTHGIDRPQSDFESFLNIGVWFNKYCK